MSIRNLGHLFAPRAVAVIGASPRPLSVGNTVLRNLLGGGFAGDVIAVNPRYREVDGLSAYASVAEMPMAADLAVICTPAATVPGIVEALAKRGTRAAIVISAGLDRAHDVAGQQLDQAMLAAARPGLVRILGPNCVGLLVPGIGLNASFAHTGALVGQVAFVSQSGALCTTVLDWACTRGIGFSHFVSLGNCADVDFGDVIDYLATTPQTRAILLYIEAITGVRKFMSAARAAARTKPIIAIKAGRVAEGARAAASHTGALAGSDRAYDAALARAGILRVRDVDELFEAAETLSFGRMPMGDRLVIVTNGGGPGVLATDALIGGGARLADLSEATCARLDRVLPANWSRANPIDIIGDASAERYRAAVEILADDPGWDALLFMHAPVAVIDSAALAAALVDPLAALDRPVFAAWLGGATLTEARRRFMQARLPTFDTPESAVRAFLHMVRYRRNHATLMETPPAAPDAPADRARAAAVIEAARSAKQPTLGEVDAKAVLAAYGVPVVATQTVGDADAAARTAAAIGFPVALKVLSPQISHKSDVGGVALDLADEAAVRAAAAAMAARLADLRPDASLAGYTVQPMARRPGAHEVIVGATTDPTFGPVILFGQGGTAVEVVADDALALVPLNLALARELIGRTRIARLLAGYRDRPAADVDALALILCRISHLMVEQDAIADVEINPLAVDEHGAVALDARIVLTAGEKGIERCAISPYPDMLEEHVTLAGRALLVRPIKPEDEPQHRAFFERLSSADVRLRFFGGLRHMSHESLTRWTQIDYDREMAFIATAAVAQGVSETLGVVRAATDPDNECTEFAIIVRSDFQGRGLGRFLLDKMVRYCRSRSTARLAGMVLQDNVAMLALARELGFAQRRLADERAYEVVLDLAVDR